MTKKLMMECGHAANATDGTGRPCCVICAGIHSGAYTPVKETPDLTGRKSKCSYCKGTADSNVDLPFFGYRGEGSPDAVERCKCGYFKVAHLREGFECPNGGFEPHGPFEFDDHYCGCRGWD